MSDRIEKIRNDLNSYGIKNVKKLYYNPSYDELFKHELKPELSGYEKGVLTGQGAVNVMTGIFTGRSPKDKYIVLDEMTKDTVWWSNQAKSSDNKPVDKEAWNHCYKLGADELSGKDLYVVDGYAGANEDTRLKVRFILEVAWQAHFVKNMFIRPDDSELDDFEPDFVVLNAAKTTNPDWEKMKRADGEPFNSDVFVIFNLTEGKAVIGGSWY